MLLSKFDVDSLILRNSYGGISMLLEKIDRYKKGGV